MIYPRDLEINDNGQQSGLIIGPFFLLFLKKELTLHSNLHAFCMLKFYLTPVPRPTCGERLLSKLLVLHFFSTQRTVAFTAARWYPCATTILNAELCLTKGKNEKGIEPTTIAFTVNHHKILPFNNVKNTSTLIQIMT